MSNRPGRSPGPKISFWAARRDGWKAVHSGAKRGGQEGLQQGILAVVEERFGPVPAALVSQVGQLTGVAAAVAQHRRAVGVASLEAFAHGLAAARLGSG
jgi:hypothetical protein